MKIEDLKEKKVQFALYFDYTGAGRGPEVIAGPFDTEKEANKYKEENDYESSDYFVDVYREENDR